MAEVTVHLVYIHGFQGNDTTFQAFPTHLQDHLAAHSPPHLHFKFTSSLYPTYKSAKPISHATKNFIEWLSTQPPGPVILLGHSMGGLLAAEAATHPSNNPDKYPGAKPTRIVGVIAFDCPYLGMHPHVVISGIASLFAGKDETTTDAQLNNQNKVNIVDDRVTDDWDSFKRRISPTPFSLASHNGSNATLSTSSAGGSSTNPRSPSPSNFLDRAVDFVATHADESVARWVRKHRDEPLKAGRRWIIERFQFGICMFDPTGLKARYATLTDWQGGLWVNYWTQTKSRGRESQENMDQVAAKVIENNEALPRIGMADTKIHGQSSNEEPVGEDKGWKLPKKPKPLSPGRHFIVLPTGLGKLLGGSQNWEKVLIEGVEDEVAAHCGLFIPEQNLDYQGFIKRTSERVFNWCEVIQKRTI